jgi:hypothetical protein
MQAYPSPGAGMDAITCGIAIVTTPDKKSAATMALIAYIDFARSFRVVLDSLKCSSAVM